MREEGESEMFTQKSLLGKSSFVENQKIFNLENGTIKLINRKSENYSEIYFKECEKILFIFYGKVPKTFVIDSKVDIKYSYELSKGPKSLYIIIMKHSSSVGFFDVNSNNNYNYNNNNPSLCYYPHSSR
jgi:hypothetical protein